MPRVARKISTTGIYHVIARGINRQHIFLDDSDFHRYLRTLERVAREEGCELFGYCLMGNHLHLLINAGSIEKLSLFMQRTGTSYAWWFNWKYEREGYVFQDRYKSECVEDDRYLLAVIRYIHRNPVKAGLVQKPEAYKWSSCSVYYGGKDYFPGLTASDFILSLFSDDQDDAVEQFIRFMKEDREDECLLEDRPVQLPKDSEIETEIIKLLGGGTIGKLKEMGRAERNEILRRAKEIEGSSIRQIARVTGIGFNIVFRA